MAAPANTCPCCASPATTPVASPAYAHCRQCGHRWRKPRGEAGSSHYYETLVERNDPQTHWFKQKITNRVAALASLITPRVRRILEIGCAEGELGAEIKARFPIAYDGVELSLDSELARKKLDQVFRTPAGQLATSHYDLIVSFHVLEHIADPGEELQAWSRLLSLDGQLLIEVPHQAGHPLLANDLNPEHLHQFTPASLTVLLASRGFTCHALSLGHYESPVYPDSIRVGAQRQFQASQQRELLLQRFCAKIGASFIAYGIGGDFQNYVAPLADALDIQALVDSSPAKWGQQLGQHVIAAYDPKLHGTLPILICSIKFGASIRQHLLSMGIAPQRIIGLEDIYADA